ncbi:MAG: peroxiredoxin family protein [Colwellia polaris]|jgi:peroxiredoxin|uniref:peroxiredoxin family protein n=1 Tax=Colwellia polaris TaxID=326537 RepID=UPI000C7714E6|nr:peroxiredoxin family protein [Colwellia polaris]|tara:strand:+ start:2371 stop:3189 length:819 start_codon:yes stop_codon:yes gene_type:complete
MNTFALTISLVGLIIMLTGIALYFSKLIKNKVPKLPIGLFFCLSVGVLTGLYSLYLAIPNAFLSVLPIAIPAVFTVFIGSFFIFVFLNKNTPLGDIKVSIGDKLIPFETKTAADTIFSSEQFKGKRTLLKFYRGSWCPYCSRELTMFEEMDNEFKKFDVQVFALSGDNAKQASAHIKRDNLSLTLLADPELEVVKKYGVEHQKSLGADSEGIMTVFGLPFPKPYQFKFKSMSIPTTILIDEHGIIKWIDQSEDYRLRASKERILSALQQSFK